MEFRTTKTEYASVINMRQTFCEEAGCQIVGDSALRRGLADPYLLLIDNDVVGYAGVWNKHYPDHVEEFHVDRSVRRHSVPLFHRLMTESGATHIIFQTNMPRMLCLAYDFATDFAIENVLFEDSVDAQLPPPEIADLAFLELENDAPNHPDSRDYALKIGDEVIARGGYLCHYNPPYADVWMEVEEPHRRQGLGSYLVQEIKRSAYANGKTPACRCNPDNHISRLTLERAGFIPCGRRITARLIDAPQSASLLG